MCLSLLAFLSIWIWLDDDGPVGWSSCQIWMCLFCPPFSFFQLPPHPPCSLSLSLPLPFSSPPPPTFSVPLCLLSSLSLPLLISLDMSFSFTISLYLSQSPSFSQFISLSVFAFILFFHLVSVNKMDWLTLPACPSLMCFCNKGTSIRNFVFDACVGVFCFMFVYGLTL